jgi:hypothetical protein
MLRTGTVNKRRKITAELSHGVGQPVPLNGGPDLLGARRDVEGPLGLEPLVQRLLDHRGDAAHVLVAGVGAGADEAVLHLEGPARLLGGGAQLGDRGGQVGGEGTVHVRLQRAQVNLNHLNKMYEVTYTVTKLLYRYRVPVPT